MTTHGLFETLRAAEISISDFARLTTISRNTLQRWKRDDFQSIRDQLRLDLANQYAARIEIARLKGRLPLKEKYRLTERTAVLRRLLS